MRLKSAALGAAALVWHGRASDNVCDEADPFLVALRSERTAPMHLITGAVLPLLPTLDKRCDSLHVTVARSYAVEIFQR